MASTVKLETQDKVDTNLSTPSIENSTLGALPDSVDSDQNLQHVNPLTKKIFKFSDLPKICQKLIICKVDYPVKLKMFMVKREFFKFYTDSRFWFVSAKFIGCNTKYDSDWDEGERQYLDILVTKLKRQLNALKLNSLSVDTTLADATQVKKLRHDVDRYETRIDMLDDMEIARQFKMNASFVSKLIDNLKKKETNESQNDKDDEEWDVLSMNNYSSEKGDISSDEGESFSVDSESEENEENNESDDDQDIGKEKDDGDGDDDSDGNDDSDEDDDSDGDEDDSDGDDHSDGSEDDDSDENDDSDGDDDSDGSEEDEG